MPSVEAKLSLDIANLQTGLEKARAEIKSFKDNAQKEGSEIGKALFAGMSGTDLAGGFLGKIGVGGGLLGALAGMKSATSGIRDLQLLSEKLGVTTDELQRMSPAAKHVKGDLEALGTSMIKLEKAMGDPSEQKVAKALQDLGLSAADLAKMSLPEKILALNKAFQEAQHSGSGVHDIAELMGKGFQELLPYLRMNTDELQKLIDKAKPMSTAMVASIAAIDAAVESSQGKLVKWGKTKLSQAAFSLGQIGAFLTTGSTKSYNQDAVNAFVAELDRQDQILADRGRASAKARQADEDAKKQARMKEQADLDREGARLDKYELSIKSGQEKINALQNELMDSVIAPLKSVTDKEVTQDSLLGWVKELRESGDLEALKFGIGLLEKWRDVSKQISDIQKAADKAGLKSTIRGLTDSNQILEQRAHDIEEQLRKTRDINVDQWRQIGGALPGVNYNALAANTGTDTLKAELELVKSAIESNKDVLMEIRDKLGEDYASTNSD
jgi:hypothetical protein